MEQQLPNERSASVRGAYRVPLLAQFGSESHLNLQSACACILSGDSTCPVTSLMNSFLLAVTGPGPVLCSRPLAHTMQVGIPGPRPPTSTGFSMGL